MSNYTSGITFLYYKDIDKAEHFYEELLGLECVLINSFGKVYKINDKSFVGAIKRKEGSINGEYTGGTLLSLTVDDAAYFYNKLKDVGLKDMTDLEVIESIPLKSFFFKDFEGHDFEIQEFLSNELKDLF